MTGPGRRWAVLAVGVLGQTAAASLVYGIPFLVPTLRDREGLSLAEAGLVVSAPVTGLMLTLVVWGAAADRFGERVVITLGLAVAGLVAATTALAAPSLLVLCAGLAVAGAGAASVNAASGRLIMGWFAPAERGLAMGIRQTAQPLGVAVAAAGLPRLGLTHGVATALLLPAVLCLASAALVAVVAHDPPRVGRHEHASALTPYRGPVLWRLHAASSLLVLPQFAVATFALEYLVREQQWSPGRAGAFVAVLQLFGAAARIGAGVWSDRAGSRLRPMRLLAVASASVMALLAVGDLYWTALAVAALAAGAVVTVADNGLAFTSVAELAGSSWAGRALGIHNTAQNVVSAVAAPGLGALIGHSGYAAGFALVAAAPLAAVWVTPVAGERGGVQPVTR